MITAKIKNKGTLVPWKITTFTCEMTDGKQEVIQSPLLSKLPAQSKAILEAYIKEVTYLSNIHFV
jgi:hypothetical protein